MSQTEYKLINTFEFPGMVARVFSPVLTEDEQNKRIKAIHKATENLMKEVTKRK